MKNEIVIVGAGPVGSLLAYLFKKRGWKVKVFEKRADGRADSKDQGRSINLVLTSRGIDALRLAGIDQEIMSLTVPVMGRMMHGPDGELSYQAYGIGDHECNYSISRSKLNQKLITLAQNLGVEFFFEHKLISYDCSNKSLVFTDNTGKELDISAPLVAAADGGGSRLRKDLLMTLARQDGEVYDYAEPLGSSYKELTIPSLENSAPALKVGALHIWPRGNQMLMALPNLDGSFTATVYMPDEMFRFLDSKDKVKKHFETFYADSIELMPRFCDEFFANPTGHLETIRAYPWHYKDQVFLIGDAAHGVVPFFGQGMNCGFEDCAELIHIVDEYGHNFSKILPIYTKKRFENGKAIADMAIENFIEMKEKVADSRFLLRKKVEKILEQRFPKQYKSRYGLVMYTSTPYHKAKKIGEIQNQILDSLLSGVHSVDELNLNLAKELIENKLGPFVSDQAGL